MPHAIDNFDLRDRDVLEVGSGRGGGASYISRYLQPRSMTGMDFCQEAVDLCNRHRLAPRLGICVWRRPINAIPGLVFRRRRQHRVLTLL